MRSIDKVAIDQAANTVYGGMTDAVGRRCRLY